MTTEPSQMTPEERTAFDHAMAEVARLEREVAEARAHLAEQSETMESLRSKRAHLESEIRGIHVQIADAKARVLDLKIESFVGEKFTAEELPEMLSLGRELGLDRMMRMLAARPNLRLIRPHCSPRN